MNCKIISPRWHKEFFRLGSVTLPAWGGQMEILPGHAEAFLVLGKGNVVLRRDLSGLARQKVFPVLGGECFVRKDRVIIVL